MSSTMLRVQGLEVPVETRGSSDRTLVFLPGFGSRPDFYGAGLDRLARHVRVVVPDLSFRSHRALPRSVSAYLDLVRAVADRFAPGAVWCGHSFGGLLALLGSRPAIALAPSVPLDSSVGRIFWRAVRLQAREMAGIDGPRGVSYAFRITSDYLKAAAFSPDAIMPALRDQVAGPRKALEPGAPRARVFLASEDRLYPPDHSRRFIASCGRAEFEVETIHGGHDWPVTDPEAFADRALGAFEAVRE